jgi:hypothetical protein
MEVFQQGFCNFELPIPDLQLLDHLLARRHILCKISRPMYSTIVITWSRDPDLPTVAMLNIEPPEPENSGSNADDAINLAHLFGMLHIVDLIC